jgi:NAD(P)-dependent dehydrogenase (short-subunit alcohol dehydrogenase family)
MLTKALAAEWASRGVRVNAVSPGWIDTQLVHEQFVAHRPRYRQIVGDTPMQRLGQPQEVSGAVVFLASDASTFVTGANLVVDGGYTTH